MITQQFEGELEDASLNLGAELVGDIVVEVDFEDQLVFDTSLLITQQFEGELEDTSLNLVGTLSGEVVTPSTIRSTQIYVEMAVSVLTSDVFNDSFEDAINLIDTLSTVTVTPINDSFEDTISLVDTLATAVEPFTIRSTQIYAEMAVSTPTPDVFNEALEDTISLVDILATAVEPFTIRSTQIYAEMAVSTPSPEIFNEALEDSINLDVELVGSFAAESEVEDQLVFNVSITPADQFDEELTEEIQFDADIEADVPLNPVDVGFTETVIFGADIEADAPDDPANASFTETLVLTESISEVRIFELVINAPLELDDGLIACHVLNLEIVADVLNEQVAIEFDEMGVGGEIVTVDLNTTIQLQERFQLGIVESLILDGVMNGHIVRPGPEDQIDESIVFEDRMVVSTLARFNDLVDFSDEMTAVVARTFEADLGFDGIFESQAELNVGTVEVLDFQILMTSLVEDDDTCRFDTRQFPTYVDPTDDPTLGDSGTLRLVSPAEGPVSSLIQLKAPNFQNRHNIAPTRTVNETRLGELIIFAAELAGPPVETLLLSFSGLKREQVRMVEQWHDDHLGQQIRLIDHEDRVWIGFISVVDDPGVEDRKMSYTLSFQFQGSLV